MQCQTTKSSSAGPYTCNKEANWELVGRGLPLPVCDECGQAWLKSPYYQPPVYNLSLRRIQLPESKPAAQCSECNGSGVYCGFTTVEPCRSCSGKGLVNS